MSALDFSQQLISPFSIAPMIDWTYSAFRIFMRLLAPNALLYTEMQTPGALFHNPNRALYHHAIEKPVALQLGGADKNALVECAKMAEQYGFAEVNLNLGCPSDRVQSGQFGACLMAEPERVADCLYAMKKAVTIPVSAKTRIGIDNQDSYDFFAHFARQLIDAGIDKLIVHARKAWLKGLNPKQNRTIPPLHYDFVYQIKREFSRLPVIINGNIESINAIDAHLKEVDGVMIGRLACQNPYQIALIQYHIFATKSLPTRTQVMQAYINYAEYEASKNTPLSLLIKPILSLAFGLKNAKLWKAALINAQQRKDFNAFKDSISLLADLEKDEDLPFKPIEAMNADGIG